MLNGINSVQKDDDRKIWRREWRYQKLDKENNFCIPFDYMTTEWPDIKMFDVEEKDFRFKAEEYEIRLMLESALYGMLFRTDYI